MQTFSALLPICAGNSSVSGEFPAQRPVTRSFDVLFDLRLNKQLGKQSWDLRRYRAHYDVILMRFTGSETSLLIATFCKRNATEHSRYTMRFYNTFYT